MSFDIFENASLFFPGKTPEVVSAEQAVDVVKETPLTEVPVANEGAPTLDLSMLKSEASEVTQVTTEDFTPLEQTTTPVNSNALKIFAEEIASKYSVELPQDKTFNSAEEIVEFFNNEIVEKEIKKGVDNRLSSIGPKGKMYLDLKEYFDDDTTTIGVIEDLEFYKSIDSNSLKDDVDTQKQLYANMLSLRGMSKEKIEEELEDAIALNKLEDKSLEAKNLLIKAAETFIDKQKIKKEAEIEAENKKFASMLESIDALENAGELKVTPEMKKAMKESISKVVYKDPKTNKTYNEVTNKQRSYGPEFEKALSFVNVMGLLSFDKDGNWKPDFSKLSSLTTKKMAQKLDQAIAEEQRFSAVGGGKSGESLASILASL